GRSLRRDGGGFLTEVESFGVAPSAGRYNNNWQPRRGRGGGVRWMANSRGGWNRAPMQPATLETGEAMELGEGAADYANGGRGGWRGGARGFVPRGRGGNWTSGEGRKRTWNSDHTKDPAELMDGGYSLEALMAAQFQEGLTPTELGEQIAKDLGERVSDTVVRIVEAVGATKALALLDDTKKAEQAGGVKVNNGSRRRTPGGVYIMLFKADADIEPAIKEKIFEAGREQQQPRPILTARRSRSYGKPQDVTKSLDELLEAKKEKEAEGETKEGESMPSTDGGEVVDCGEKEDTPGPAME
ncbi:hypothetical protein PFISCL1PPCAC_22540, partial [Pristionchus fissidentatus]